MNRHPAIHCRDGSTCRRTRPSRRAPAGEGRFAGRAPIAPRGRCYHPRDDVGRGPAGRALSAERERCARGRPGRRVDEGPPRSARRRRLHLARRSRGARRGAFASHPVRRRCRDLRPRRAHLDASRKRGRGAGTGHARHRAVPSAIRRAIVRRGCRRDCADHRRDARSDVEADGRRYVRRLFHDRRRNRPRAAAGGEACRSIYNCHNWHPRARHQRRPPPSKPSRRPRRLRPGDISASRWPARRSSAPHRRSCLGSRSPE